MYFCIQHPTYSAILGNNICQGKVEIDEEHPNILFSAFSKAIQKCNQLTKYQLACCTPFTVK